ncbi:MAG TPA: TlpA disulfide reductase family protein [Polyangiaceae bacterium]|jgi:thiol-disulfide isomerase/thioredoxin|nr:TlpA disulfide reductase family protein [Polyangiaceae bacterium]
MASRKITYLRIVIAAGIGAVAIAAFVQPSRSRPSPARLPVPAPSAPPVRNLEHPTTQGLIALGSEGLLERVKHTHAKGVVISMWASWCDSCKGDLPILVALPKTFGSDIELMLVSVDEESGLTKAAEMLRGFGATPPTFVVDQPLAAFKAAINPRWPGMLPATFLFDPTGKLRYYWGGPVHEDELTPLLRRYLAGEHIDGEADFTLSAGSETH